VIALDDLGSELDRNHQGRVLDRLLAGPAQIFITATETPVPLLDRTDIARFHVEHGLVTGVP
jgi:DNA replication and repair protein RecF